MTLFTIQQSRSLDPVRAARVGCLEEHAAHAAHGELLAAGPALAHVARRGGVQLPTYKCMTFTKPIHLVNS